MLRLRSYLCVEAKPHAVTFELLANPSEFLGDLARSMEANDVWCLRKGDVPWD